MRLPRPVPTRGQAASRTAGRAVFVAPRQPQTRSGRTAQAYRAGARCGSGHGGGCRDGAQGCGRTGRADLLPEAGVHRRRHRRQGPRRLSPGVRRWPGGWHADCATWAPRTRPPGSAPGVEVDPVWPPQRPWQPGQRLWRGASQGSAHLYIDEDRRRQRRARPFAEPRDQPARPHLQANEFDDGRRVEVDHIPASSRPAKSAAAESVAGSPYTGGNGTTSWTVGASAFPSATSSSSTSDAPDTGMSRAVGRPPRVTVTATPDAASARLARVRRFNSRIGTYRILNVARSVLHLRPLSVASAELPADGRDDGYWKPAPTASPQGPA